MKLANERKNTGSTTKPQKKRTKLLMLNLTFQNKTGWQ
jgi:hypothetical protein